MGLLNTVSREQYETMKQDRDDWRVRYDALFAAYERLRPTHTPATPIRIGAPQEEPGARALHGIEATINSPRIKQIAESLIATKPELSLIDAMIEAKRLDDIARGRAVAPTTAPPSEPPSR